METMWIWSELKKKFVLEGKALPTDLKLTNDLVNVYQKKADWLALLITEINRIRELFLAEKRKAEKALDSLNEDSIKSTNDASKTILKEVNIIESTPIGEAVSVLQNKLSEKDNLNNEKQFELWANL